MIDCADKTAEKQLIGRPFQKGVSGNPNGRPKGSFSIKDKIRQHLEDNPEEMDEMIRYFLKRERSLVWQMLEGRPPKSLDIVSQSKSSPSPIMFGWSQDSEFTLTDEDKAKWAVDRINEWLSDNRLVEIENDCLKLR